MERLLARLERRFGRYAPENLTVFLVGGMGLAFLLMMARPDFGALLVLDLHAVARGQVWRLFTYLFLPFSSSPLWVLFDLYFFWMVGSNLESEWGSFKYDLYWLVGMIGTTVAALITGAAVGNFYLLVSLGFAFATLFPDFSILLFFILPVRVKWLGWLLFAFVAYQFVQGDWVTRAAILASVGNYLLFFSGTILRFVRGGRAAAQSSSRRASFRPPAPVPAKQARACAICGARESDGADIRVCSCDKCKAATGGGARELCLEHARNH